jgi:hypothetical protein
MSKLGLDQLWMGRIKTGVKSVQQSSLLRASAASPVRGVRDGRQSGLQRQRRPATRTHDLGGLLRRRLKRLCFEHNAAGPFSFLSLSKEAFLAFGFSTFYIHIVSLSFIYTWLQLKGYH